MPELPEVETVKESLKLRLIGKKIKGVNILWDNIIAYPSKEEFARKIGDRVIEDIKRRGKFLMFDLGDYYLALSMYYGFSKFNDVPSLNREISNKMMLLYRMIGNKYCAVFLDSENKLGFTK